MTNYQEVFKRVEKKYRVSAQQRTFIENAMSEYMAPDAYGLTHITSIYFDTPDYALISRSLEKPLYKEKLRIRAYGYEEGIALSQAFGTHPVLRHMPERDPRVFLELKKKYKGVVYKRRTGMTLSDACVFMTQANDQIGLLSGEMLSSDNRPWGLCPNGLYTAQRCEPSSVNEQIEQEVIAMIKRYPQLGARMAIACDRIAWAPAAPYAHALEGLRITFDSELTYQEYGALQALPIIDAQESIMEIKSASSLPLWLTSALSQAHIYPTSFSKYGTAYRIACQSSWKGNRCA